MTAAVPSILFTALETYSLVGGLQAFNRRVIANLSALSATGTLAPPTVHLLRDRAADVPRGIADRVTTFERGRLGFVAATLREVLRHDVLLIGHVNLLSLAWAARRLRPALRIGLFVHGDEVWNTPEFRPMPRRDPYLLRAVDLVASVSSFTADVMAREFGFARDRYRLLPNAVDPLPPVERPPLAPAGTGMILSVGRLGAGDRRKHFDLTIRAFADVAATRPGATLEIVGDGVLRPELEALAASLGLGERVRFHGRASDAALADAYARATAFALPSAKEGFGIVYLEAWQRGVPVICGAEGASHEIIDDGIDGFVVDTRSHEMLAARMAWLLDHPAEARAMGEHGRHKVDERYLDDAFRDNLARFCAELAAIRR